MLLSTIDWAIVGLFFLVSLSIGIYTSKKAGKSADEFFLSGRNMPWWLLGVSMVATTFSTDTPNLVTDIVRQDGVAGNWAWWAFLLTGMLTVFVYAKLWRRSGVKTDMEFYELRYGGKPARFLRGFRALYLGVAFNVLAMAGVTLAAIKVGKVMLNLDPIETIGIAAAVTVVFSSLGGFRGVILTDFILFFTAMIGAFGAAWVALDHPDVGGLENLLAQPAVQEKLNLFPDFSDTNNWLSLLFIPLAVQWWSSWYPGAEPGGGGYIAQRMLAAKNENHAIGATFFFNIMHYAVRPWPWILVALASLVVFPDLESLRTAFPDISDDKIGHDLAYPAMLTFLPTGLIGIVMASLIAAYMSTISTHLNWGASYVVNDFYKRFVNKDASQKNLVSVGRLTTVVLMVLAAIVALSLNNAKQLFDFILLFGAGTGLIFILRWFWWRINAWSEIIAMFSSGIVAIILNMELASSGMDTWMKLPIGVGITTVIWIVVTMITPPESVETLKNFCKKIKMGGPGWKPLFNQLSEEEKKEVEGFNWNIPMGLSAMFVGCILIYSLLFCTGYFLYGDYLIGTILLVVSSVSAFVLIKLWKKLSTDFL